MKKKTKQELRSMSVKQLQAKLVELEKEKMHLKVQIHSVGYAGSEGSKWQGGNMKNLNKNIARVKTYLNMKLKNE